MNSILLTMMLALNPSADFSGHWVLDKAQSSGLPGYYDKVKSHAITNTLHEGKLDVAVELDIGQAETDKMQFTYALDGSSTSTESKIRGPNGLVNVPTSLQALVEAGGRLHITIERHIQDKKAHMTEDWELSPDGKTITIHRVDEGKRHAQMVFVKA